jgi:hypothetical protein
MTFRTFLILGFLTCGLSACSSSAPEAPLGFDKRPANSAETVASLTAQPQTQDGAPAARLPVASSVATPSPLNAGARSTSAAGVVIVSDFSAPGGVWALSTDAKVELISAARAAQRITLYCRGDWRRPSPQGRAALLRRGVEVRRFLIAQGIAPARIRLYVRSAGAFVADNTTVTGRAKNRRVEIRFA